MPDEFEKYRNPDGSIDWGKKSMDELYADLEKPQRKIVELEDLHVFQLADTLSDYIWDVVQKWNYFAKKTVGDQYVLAPLEISRLKVAAASGRADL